MQSCPRCHEDSSVSFLFYLQFSGFVVGFKSYPIIAFVDYVMCEKSDSEATGLPVDPMSYQMVHSHPSLKAVAVEKPLTIYIN